MSSPSASPNTEPDDEIALAAALKRLLTEERFTDVSLRGTDSKVVRASRNILSARSKVFERMLMGHFEESSNSVVSVGYKSNVLQAVVEYIYTDTACVLEAAAVNCDVAIASTLASVAAAAAYFGLSTLCHKTQEACCKVMIIKPQLACVFLNEFFTLGPVVPLTRAQQFSVDTIRAYPRSSLLEAGAMSLTVLSPAVLKEIVRDDKLLLSELDRFRLIQSWVGVSDYDYSSGEPTPQRKEQALDMTTVLHLDRIDPTDLAAIVSPSGLVATAQLLDAYQAQAMQAKAGAFSFPTMRFYRWENAYDAEWTEPSSEWVTDTVSCPPVRSGVCQWTISINRRGGNMALGLLLRSSSEMNENSIEKSYVGANDCSWGYRYSGETYHRGGSSSAPLPKYGDGSGVTLTLDLRPTSKGNGTLSACVDGGDHVLLFSNLQLKIPDHDLKVGFVPAASVRSNGSIRLIGISDQLVN